MEYRLKDCQIRRIEVPTPFPVGPVNVYLIEGRTVTLVDTGPKTEEARQAVLGGLEEAGVDISCIKQILLTHHHIDHCGLGAELAAASGAAVLAHPYGIPNLLLTEAYAQTQNGFYGSLYTRHGVPEEAMAGAKRYLAGVKRFMDPLPKVQPVAGGELLPGEPGWQVLFAPGHTQNHILLYHPEERVMIGGDFLLLDVSSNAFIEPPPQGTGPRPKSLLMYRESLRAVAAMEIATLLPAHGGEIRDHRGLIAARLERQGERARRLWQLLEDGPKTAYQLSALLFPKNHLTEMALTLSETLGHLDLLEEEGLAARELKDGVWYYHHLQ